MHAATVDCVSSSALHHDLDIHGSSPSLLNIVVWKTTVGCRVVCLSLQWFSTPRHLASWGGAMPVSACVKTCETSCPYEPVF